MTILDKGGKPFEEPETPFVDVWKKARAQLDGQSLIESMTIINDLRKSCGVEPKPGETIKWRRFDTSGDDEYK